MGYWVVLQTRTGCILNWRSAVLLFAARCGMSGFPYSLSQLLQQTLLGSPLCHIFNLVQVAARTSAVWRGSATASWWLRCITQVPLARVCPTPSHHDDTVAVNVTVCQHLWPVQPLHRAAPLLSGIFPASTAAVFPASAVGAILASPTLGLAVVRPRVAVPMLHFLVS